MSHDPHGPQENKTVISFKNSFWLVIIIVGLFIAALNFIKAESNEESAGKEQTEVKANRESPGNVMEKAASNEEAQPKHEAATPATDSSAKGGK